jgi:hypothetical protein
MAHRRTQAGKEAVDMNNYLSYINHAVKPYG